MDNRKILIEYCDMKAQIKLIKESVTKIEDRLRKIEEEGVVSDVVSGGMGGIEHFKITGFPSKEHSKVEKILKKRKERLDEKEEELLEMMNLAEEYILSIDKIELQTMFLLYYIEDLTWEAVAIRMNSLYPKRKIAYTEENCKKRNQRFFEKNLEMSTNVPL